MGILQKLAKTRKQDIGQIKEAIQQFQEKKSPKYDIKGFNNKKKQNRITLSEKIGLLRKEKNNTELFGIISELKAGSPSKGMIIRESDIKPITDIMQPSVDNLENKIQHMIKGGIIGISVLTEPRKFFGSFGNLLQTSQILPLSYPLLLKDFIIDEAQIQLGRLCGASNGLIIAKICDPIKMAKKMHSYGLEPLIEIHDHQDLEKIKPLKDDQDMDFVIGINNRNLKDLSIELNTTRLIGPKVRKYFGSEQPLITESGIKSYKDLLKMDIYGIKYALIGTAIMEDKDTKKITQNIKKLQGVNKPFVKICGIQKEETLMRLRYMEPSPTAVGFIVEIPESSRNLNLQEAKYLLDLSPKSILKTIVITKSSIEEIEELDDFLEPDLIQIHIPHISKIFFKLPPAIQRKLVIPIKTINGNLEEKFKMVLRLGDSPFSYLLDSSEGKGKQINLEMAKRFFERFPEKRIVIAGGITPANVGGLLETLQPFGVDASSSLEVDGIKDIALIQDYMNEIKKHSSTI